jgi:hypothetical protein
MAMSISERREYQRSERAALAESGYPFDDLDDRVCRECGCCDVIACPDGCWWVQADLCSACAAELAPRAHTVKVDD